MAMRQTSSISTDVIYLTTSLCPILFSRDFIRLVFKYLLFLFASKILLHFTSSIHHWKQSSFYNLKN